MEKTILRIINCTLILLIISNINLFGQVRSDRIIVKFRPGSSIAHEMLRTGHSGQFSQILGSHTAERYISDNILKLLKQKAPNNNLMAPKKSHAENLSRIFVVKYSSGIEPRMAAGKIGNHPQIEYAEPSPLHRIIDQPNDPDLTYQYYVFNIKAIEAREQSAAEDTLVIGIVDTGVDYEHPDLAENMYINPGESGTDAQGNDRRSNGIDDDDNGFIDDWRGWDFVSGDDPDGDNDPRPGNPHGTHVAGITNAVTNNGVGIAGIARNATIMPVKIGQDHPMSKSVENSFEGLLYAAANGADIINCSWGSSSRSEAEQEVIDAAIDKGATIVAAAGNNGSNQLFHPAAYRGVMSVAAVNSEDVKASFSNYHYSVDISAPGTAIYSTVPDSSYDLMGGTSMASPVVAGVTALVKHEFPEYSSFEIIEQIKATSDDIYQQNIIYKGMLGKGRVNALTAISQKSARAVIMENYTAKNENNDDIIDIGERVDITFDLLNVLAPLKNVRAELHCVSTFRPAFIDSLVQLGDMARSQSLTSDAASFIVPDDIPMNYEMEFRLDISADEDFSSSEYFTIMMRPSYRTMRANNIAATFNSRGNIAYNDYPDNTQGDGFSYKNSPGILYEGALMAGISPDRLSNVARGAFQLRQDDFFISKDIFTIENPGVDAAREGIANYGDLHDSVSAGIDILQKVYQFDAPGRRDFIIVAYDVINSSQEFFDSLYVGLYFDWDIGPNGQDNIAGFNSEEIYGYVRNVVYPQLPVAGALLLSDQKVNYFAIDNGGNPGVYDGFTRSEKWSMMTGGIDRKQSSVTDASMVIAAGPIRMPAGDTTRIAFSIFCADSIKQLKEVAKISRQTANEYDLADGGYKSLPVSDTLAAIYPNPPQAGEIFIDFSLSASSLVSLEVFDALGRKVGAIFKSRYRSPGYYTERFNTAGLASGRYYIRLRTGSGWQTEPFNVIR
jgi:subtilisin family serine protease